MCDARCPSAPIPLDVLADQSAEVGHEHPPPVLIPADAALVDAPIDFRVRARLIQEFR